MCAEGRKGRITPAFARDRSKNQCVHNRSLVFWSDCSEKSCRMCSIANPLSSHHRTPMMAHEERNFCPSLISDDSERESMSTPVPVFDFFSASKKPQSMPATAGDAAKVPPSLCLTLTPSPDPNSPSSTMYSQILAPSECPASGNSQLHHHSPSPTRSNAMKASPPPSLLDRLATSSSSDNDGSDPHIDGQPSEVMTNDSQDYEQSREHIHCQAGMSGVKNEDDNPAPALLKGEKECPPLHDANPVTCKPVKPKASHGRTADTDDQPQWQADASRHQQQQQKRAPPLPYHWPFMGLFSPPAVPPCMPHPFATPWLYGYSPQLPLSQYPMQEAMSLAAAAAMNVNPAMAAAAAAALGPPLPPSTPALTRPHPAAAPTRTLAPVATPAGAPAPARPNGFPTSLPGGVSYAREGGVPYLLPCNTSNDNTCSVATANYRDSVSGHLMEHEPGAPMRGTNEGEPLQKSASAGFRPWRPAATRGKMPWSQLVQPGKPTPPLAPMRSSTAPCVPLTAGPLAWPPAAAGTAAAAGALPAMPHPPPLGTGGGTEAGTTADFNALYGMRHPLWGCGMPSGYLATAPGSTGTAGASADEMKRRLGKIRLPARGTKRQRVDNSSSTWIAETHDRPDMNHPADSCRTSTCGSADELAAPEAQKQVKTPACGEGEERTARICNNCGTVSTPFWRKDPADSGMHLCNACGLYMAKNDAPRPSSLWKKAG